MNFCNNDVFRLFRSDVSSQEEMIFILDEVNSDKIYYSICYHDGCSNLPQACGTTAEELEEFLSGLTIGEKFERSRLCLQQEVILREGSSVDLSFDQGLIESFDGTYVLVRNNLHTWNKHFEFLDFWKNFYLKAEEVFEEVSEAGYSQGYLEGHSGLKWL